MADRGKYELLFPTVLFVASDIAKQGSVMKMIVSTAIRALGIVLFAGMSHAQTPPGGVPIPTTSDFGDPGDQFGYILAADGNWAVASGSFGEAFYVYERLANGTWTRRQRILPPVLGQAFFRTPHLRGNRLVISRPSDPTASPAGSGTVYVYQRNDSASPFTLNATLRPADAQTGDRFGYGLAQTDDRIFVGASARDEGANTDQGAVYVFRLNAGTWVQETRMSPPDAGASARFGQDLAFDGQDLLVGAQRHRVSASALGAVYVYRLLGGAWTQVQKITEPGTPGSTSTRFGYQLSADNGRAFIQGLGFFSEYFFTRDGSGTWGNAQALPDPMSGATVLNNGVGNSDLIDGRMVMLAPSAVSYTPTFVQGPWFLVSYRLSGSTWERVSRVQLPAEIDNPFDGVVAIASNTLLSGQPLLDASASSPDQGAILPYALAADSTIGPASTRIWHGTGNIPDRLGSATAADGDWIMTSAPGSDAAGIDREALYWFKRQVDGVWQLRQTVVGATAASGACSLAISGDLAAVGRCGETVGGVAQRGSVAMYRRQPDDQWTELCALAPVDPTVTLFGSSVALSPAGIWVSSRQQNATGFKVDSYPLPTSGCQTGRVLATPTSGQDYRFGNNSLSGARGVLTLQCLNNPCTSSVLVYEQSGGIWTSVQTITLAPPTGNNVERPFFTALDGDRLAVAISVPIGASIDSRIVVRLYERPGAEFTFVRTIEPSAGSNIIGVPLALRGDTLLLDDDSISSNGGVAIYQFSTGTHLQSLNVSGLTADDGFSSNLAMGANDRAVVGWPELDRSGYNNAGLIYTLELSSTRATNSWGIVPVTGAPLPDRLFSYFFEEDP